MIITVTFNPAIDKTAEVETLQLHGLNRLCNVIQDAGGKGINVSKTIRALQGESIATGFLAGSSGNFIASYLNDHQIQHDFIWVDGMTRTNLKVLDKEMNLTEFNETGPSVTIAQVEQLLSKILSYVKEDTFVILSGNVPLGVPTTIYQDMIISIHDKGGHVILDADGELFANGVLSKPDVIKPNKYEVMSYFKLGDDTSNEQLISHAQTLLNEKTKLIVISMGKEGSIFITKQAIWKVDAVRVEAHSSVGAGDAMVAGIAYAMQHAYEIEELIKLAVATSTGAVMTKGTQPADKHVIEQLMQKVTMTKMEV